MRWGVLFSIMGLLACSDSVPPIAGGATGSGMAVPDFGDASVCPSHTRTAEDAIQATIDGLDMGCASDADCTRVSVDTDCSASCGRVVAMSERETLQSTVQAQNEGTCVGFVEADCPLSIPPCPPPLEVACVAGTCSEVFRSQSTPVVPTPGPIDAGTPDDEEDGGVTDGGPDGDMVFGDCIDDTLTFFFDGGFVAFRDEHVLAPCAEFSITRTSFGDPGSDGSCSNQVADDAPITVADVQQALAHPDVQMAFGTRVIFGADTRPADGQIFRIELGGDVIEVGSQCMGGGGCLPIPTGVQLLQGMLQNLIAQQRALPDCDGL